jgi:hypothetical protein
LAALAHPDLALEDFPMSKYIIYASVEKNPPEYMRAIKDQVDFKCIMPMDPDKEYASDYGLADLLDTSTWPSVAQSGMDESQYAAFRAALTREISIIQGPPGTGKTYIGVQIAKFLLANEKHFLSHTATVETIVPPSEYELEAYRSRTEYRKQIREKREKLGLRVKEDEEELEEPLPHVKTETTIIESPVLVVCYTNHALDQFLEAIYAEMVKLGLSPKNELIRVGGQTKSEEMMELTMFKLLEEAVRERKLPYDFISSYKRSSHFLGKTKSVRHTLLDLLRNFRISDGILDLESTLEQGWKKNRFL